MAFAMTQGRVVRSALAGFVRVGDGIVLRHIRCQVYVAEIGHVIDRVVCLVLTCRDAMDPVQLERRVQLVEIRAAADHRDQIIRRR